jgi:Tol biopolymer transport system component
VSKSAFSFTLAAAATCAALLLPGAAQAAPAGKILFTSTRDGHDEVYVMNADGSGQTPLTSTGPGTSNFAPDWSPDGKQIAFVSDRDAGTDDELWIMNADGSAPHQITFNDVQDSSVRWSRDGKQLVFVTNPPGGVNNIFLINVDGSGLKQLTFFPVVGGSQGGFGPHFSPDGTKIVFTNGTTDPRPLNLITPAGASLGALTSIDSLAPHFTADGKRIVFWSDVDGDAEIYSIAAVGGDQKQLTFTPSIAGLTDQDLAPSPSRDGLDRIAFTSRRGGDQELYLMNADGSGLVQLTNTNPGDNRGPDWQPTAVCQGKVATIVGTAAAETLTGGPNADIISGQGGKDQISGLDGNDIACGDAGKDTLKGGKGKDVLNGGKGNDKLIGGKGKDKCIGGKGKKDTGKGCETEKKIP